MTQKRRKRAILRQRRTWKTTTTSSHQPRILKTRKTTRVNAHPSLLPHRWERPRVDDDHADVRRRELGGAMSGLELVAPGLVDVVAWPDGGEPARPTWMYGAVGRVVG